MILTVSLCSMAALTIGATLYVLYERREVERQKRDYARLEDGLRDAHSEIQRLFRRLGEAQKSGAKLEHANIMLSGENDRLRDAHSEIQRLFRRLGEAQKSGAKLEHANIMLSGENDRLRDQIEQAEKDKKQLCEEIEKLLDENREQADKLSEIGNIFSYAGDEAGQVELND